MECRDKFLAEAMGHKVRTVTPEKREFKGPSGTTFIDFVCSCCNGPQSACANYAIDFSTWEGFGKLLTYLDGEMSDKEIADMLYNLTIDGCVQNLPDKIANYIYLKDRDTI